MNFWIVPSVTALTDALDAVMGGRCRREIEGSLGVGDGIQWIIGKAMGGG